MTHFELKQEKSFLGCIISSSLQYLTLQVDLISEQVDKRKGEKDRTTSMIIGGYMVAYDKEYSFAHFVYLSGMHFARRRLIN